MIRYAIISTAVLDICRIQFCMKKVPVILRLDNSQNIIAMLEGPSGGGCH